MSAPQTLPQNSPAEAEASCRLPLLVFFGGAAFWLVVASVLGHLASIKLHSPSFLADCPYSTYGKLLPAATNALLYGFASQAAFGVALWLAVRLGSVAVPQPWLIAFSGKIWNLGVLVGVAGIFAGDSTGFEWLEMPRYAAVPLFFSSLFISLRTLITFHRRTERGLAVPQWYLVAALLWFPWVYSTANLLLFCHPVRGVMQAIVGWWFVNNFQMLWLTPLALAAIFHFLPTLAERPLHSRYLALFGFWMLALFGGWSGVPASAPVPAWIVSVSNAAAVMLLIPALAVGLNIVNTLRGAPKIVGFPGGPYCFLRFAVCSYLVATVAGVVIAASAPGAVAQFTWLKTALTHLNLYGFVAMAFFGAIYEILPRVTGAVFCGKFICAHFWLAVLGTVIHVGALGFGGLKQGALLGDAQMPFHEVIKTSLVFFRVGTVGELLILLGNLLFAFNFVGLLVKCAKKCCGQQMSCCGAAPATAGGAR